MVFKTFVFYLIQGAANLCLRMGISKTVRDTRLVKWSQNYGIWS